MKKYKKGSKLKPVPSDRPGLGKLPSKVRNAMGYMKAGGSVSKPKMQMGGQPESYASRKIKTVSVSPDKKYKTTVKEKIRPEGVSTTVTNRRTVKGLLTGAPKASMMKMGGAMKSTIIKKKK